MFVIDEVTVEEPIAHERFACDLGKCKGACCTMPGGRGAPLEDDEVEKLQYAYSKAKKYLSKEHRSVIERYGMVEGVEGNYATACIDGKNCVFVYYEEGIARCSIEKAFIEGELQWRKPISCHLFPIRVSANGWNSLRYEKISECHPGRVMGKNNDVPLYEFLKDALVRRFGKGWYQGFREECQRHDSVSHGLLKRS